MCVCVCLFACVADMTGISPVCRPIPAGIGIDGKYGNLAIGSLTQREVHLSYTV